VNGLDLYCFHLLCPLLSNKPDLLLNPVRVLEHALVLGMAHTPHGCLKLGREETRMLPVEYADNLQRLRRKHDVMSRKVTMAEDVFLFRRRLGLPERPGMGLRNTRWWEDEAIEPGHIILDLLKLGEDVIGDEAVHVPEGDVGAFIALSAVVVLSTGWHPTFLFDIPTFETVDALNFEVYEAVTVFPVPDDLRHWNSGALRKEL